jgi:hypothetical protein
MIVRSPTVTNRVTVPVTVDKIWFSGGTDQCQVLVRLLGIGELPGRTSADAFTNVGVRPRLSKQLESGERATQLGGRRRIPRR